MRSALAELNPDLVRNDPEWVVRIVGIEPEKSRLLDDFTDPTRFSPAVATTSRLLSTGVDVEDLKYVVLFRPIGSMTEFKQIIGRGTRLYPEKGKTSFEIIDYVGATRLFNDPAFDGYPANIKIETIDDNGEITATTDENPEDESLVDVEVNEPEPPFTATDGPDGASYTPPPDPPITRRKYYVDEGNFTVESDARLVPIRTTQGLQLTDYGQYIRNQIRLVGSADEMVRAWASASSRHQMIATLEAQDVDLAELVDAVGQPDVDPLDALFHLAWNLPVRTRAARVRRAREAHATELEAMSQRARDILEGLLQRYESYGIADIEDPKVLQLDPLRRLGSPVELANSLGGSEQLRHQLDLAQEWIYS
jgi:type I restriction enzyme R subunit